jgi:hypothetical protein
MNTAQLTQLYKDISDVLSTGRADRNAMNEVAKRRRRDLEAEAIVRFERKFKQGVESDNIDVHKTLKDRKIVILEDGTVFFPEDAESTIGMSPQKGTVITENATIQSAGKRFIGSIGASSIAKSIYSSISKIPNFSFSITYRFYDLLSDTESQDFFNNNVFKKLEDFKNRVDDRSTNYSRILNDKIYGQQVGKKTLAKLFKSNLLKTARVFSKKEGLSLGGVTIAKKGDVENLEFGKTSLVLNDRKGDNLNLFEGATNSEVINLYNSLRDYDFLTKTFMKDGRFNLEDALKVIEHVNQNPELKKRADALVETYASIAVDLAAKMDEIGKDLNFGEYMTEDEYRASSLAKNKGDQVIANAQTAQYMSILRAFYGNNIPKIIPYVPISAEKTSSKNVEATTILDQNRVYNPGLAFPNLLERKGGGNLILKSYQESFDNYVKNVSRFIEGTDLLSDFSAIFNGNHSSRILTQQFGEEWVKQSNDKVVDVILERNKPGSSFLSLGAVNVLLLNPTSAVSQLSSAPSFLVSLDNMTERKQFLNILKDGKKYREYATKVLNSNYTSNRINMSNHEYDAAMLRRLSTEGGMFSFGGVVGDTVSDTMFLTSLSDAASVVYGGAAFFGVKYEAKLKEYKRTMNAADADAKATKEAMLDLARSTERTQQSSQEAYLSDFRRNPILRAMGATAFSSSSLQAGEMAVKAFRDLKNGRGNKKENILKVMYFGTLAPTIFTLTGALLRGAFDDDDDPAIKLANDALNNALEQLTIVGKVVAMTKDYFLEEYAPEAVGMRMKYNKSDNDIIIKYASDLAPGLGVKVRDIKAAIDSKGKRTVLERTAAGIQATTNIPIKRFLDIGANIAVMINSDYSNMVRIKGLSLQIPESERIKHRDYIESVKNRADEMVNLSTKQSIHAMSIKDPIERRRFIEDALTDRKVQFIDSQLKTWFETGYSASKQTEIFQQERTDALNDIKNNYLKKYIDAIKSGDKEESNKSIDKLLSRIEHYEKTSYDVSEAIKNDLDKMATDLIKEETDNFKSLSKFSSGKPRGVALYSLVGGLLMQDFDSPGTIGTIKALEEEGVLNKETIREYAKYVREKRGAE